MRADRTWILVADAARADVYRSIRSDDVRRAIERVPGGEFRYSRRRRHLGSRPGKMFANALGDARHGVATHERRDRLETDHFILEVATWLGQPSQASRFEHLILVAPPRVIGVLRRLLPEPLAQKLVREVRADLTKADIQEIQRHVESSLSPTHAAG